MRSSFVRLVIAALVLLACGRARAAGGDSLQVRVLHTTDLHGALAAWDDFADKPAARGLEKVAALVNAARADSLPTLLLDAGDALYGSPLVATWREGPRRDPEPVIAAMNALRYDAMAIGNHEFDAGRPTLDSAVARAKFAFIAANVVDARTGNPAYGSSIVREFAGARIGVLGLTTPAIPALMDSSAYSGLRFLDPVEVARREVQRLRGAERCDVVVAVVHSGLERDPGARGGEAKPRLAEVPNENLGYRLAYEVQGLDVVILGHTHQVVQSVKIGGALVTQAGRNGEALGDVRIAFTRASGLAPWKLAGVTASVTAVTDTVASDPALHALVAPYAEATRATLDQIVAEARDPLSAPLGRFGDSPLWQLIHRCQLEYSSADVSLAALFDPTQTIPAGPVRRRDLVRLYPYDNSLGVVELSGAELKATLEHAASMLNTYAYDGTTPVLKPEVPGFQFDGAYGVDYEIDLSRPEGARVLNLRWKGKALDPNARLKVVANSYRLAGGGDYVTLRRARRVWQLGQPMPQLLARWVNGKHTLTAEGAPSWTVLPDYAGAAERPLIDRLVRLGVAPKADVQRLGAMLPARRPDLDGWIARAFGKAAPAAKGGNEPAATVAAALDACERAARTQRYAVSAKGKDEAFRRGLLTGVPGTSATITTATITRAQWLGMLSNLRFPTIRVLETSDFHGAILGGARERRTQRPIGGTAAIAATITRERALNPEGTVLIDGGDLFQGTMVSNLQFGRPVVEQMNLLGYTAGSVGNHEFDWGVDTLVRRVREMKFADLAANMVEKSTGKRPAWARGDTTVTRRGVRVGLLGLAYPGTPRVTLPANVAHLRFDDDSTTAAVVSARLRKAGATLVVGFGHIPAETDSTRRARGDLPRLAKVAGVDAWFGGHSHNVVDDKVDGKPVMIPGSLGQYLAVADLVMDPVKKKVVESSQRVLTAYADGPQDSAWTARVAHWNTDVAAVAAEVIGTAGVALHRRSPETTIGDFICDAMRVDAKVDIALQNPGGMRADLNEGPITRGEVYAVMPFDNTIVTMELTGAQVKLALEQSLRGGRVTQVSGVRYVLEPSSQNRWGLKSVTLADGSPLDPEKSYTVAVNNFMASGGDSYNVLAEGKSTDTGRLIRDAMEKYVRDQCAGGKSLDIPGDGRITRNGGRSGE
ncbi:MAG TPA: 5'-nucleotidase C-terminal domain-containing protein [Methylomirabilota bacterium]|nr:5'-nucleotidase C-terminal domain-containing protein [Methylomirabilota bacterium]